MNVDSLSFCLPTQREVGYLEAVQTLGSFRQAECLVFGSKSWKQVFSGNQ